MCLFKRFSVTLSAAAFGLEGREFTSLNLAAHACSLTRRQKWMAPDDLESLTQPGHEAMSAISSGTARRKISNELWATLEPLLPIFTPSPKGGRHCTVDDRAALNGILYVLQTGIPWEDLSQDLGFAAV